MKTLAIICLSILLTSQVVKGQTREEFEQERARLRKEMSDYIAQERRDFADYIEKINKEYADYLRKNWKSFQLLQAVVPDSVPKPTNVPRFNPRIEKVTPGAPVNILPVPQQSIAPEKVPQEPVIPVILPDEEPEPGIPEMEEDSVPPGISPVPDTPGEGISFYGRNLEITFDPAMKGTLPAEIGNAVIASFWERINKTGYSHVIRRLSDLKTSMNLGDWGYFMLVRKTSGLISADSNYSRLLTWFLMTKSGYRIRVAYYDNQVAVLFPSVNKIYGMHYFMIGNVKFYATDFKPNQIFTYEKDFPGASKALDLNIFSPPAIGEDYVSKSIEFVYQNRSYSINAEYNREAIEFYRDFPLCEVKLYFDAAVSPRTKETLISSLKPYIENMTETETVNFLLAFVQKGFAYKTDPEQFGGREKFFFPEETLYYPFSDCEDRAVLFSWLVRELTGLKVIGLVYPGHVATAVCFTGQVDGDYVMYRDIKYTLADPTYVDAPFGLTMPGMKNSTAEVVDLSGLKNDKGLIATIWEKIEEDGGSMGENFQSTDRDSEGNFYIAGYFKGSLTIGGTTLTSNPLNKDAFIARFNKHGNPEWAISGGCEGNAMAANIRIDEENNLFVAGTFEKSIRFGGIMMLANAPSNTFIIKLNSDGKVLWMNQKRLDTTDTRDAIHVLSLNREGKVIKSEKYPPDPNFNNYGISFDNQQNIYYTATYAYLTGLVDKLSLAAESTYNIPAILKEGNDRQIRERCNPSVAGLFSALILLRDGQVALSGREVQAAFEKYNPDFKKNSPGLYASIGKISLIKNEQGIITIITEDQKPIGLDRMKISHNTRVKLSLLANGDARIDILGGVKVGKSIIWYNLNYIRLYRSSGTMLFDYDSDHSQVTINVKKDLL
jgi:hypothetical protein